MSAKRDIPNTSLQEMISDPAVAGILEAFDFSESKSTVTGDRKAQIKERIRRARKLRRISEADEFDIDDEDLDLEDDELDIDEEDLDFEDEGEMDLDFEDEDEGEDFEDEADPLDALSTARAALDDIEGALGEGELDLEDEEIDVDDDIDLDDIEDEDEDEEDEELEESARRRRIRKAIKEARRRAGRGKQPSRLRESRSQRQRRLSERTAEIRRRIRTRRIRESVQAKLRERKLAEYKKGRLTLRVIEARMRKLKTKLQSGSLKEARTAKRARSKFLEMKRDRAVLKRALSSLREELYSTGGPTKGEQVDFPKMPKKTQTGTQKQKNTKTEFPKKAKAPQKGHNWPKHGSASSKTGETVKKPGSFPGKSISRMK